MVLCGLMVPRAINYFNITVQGKGGFSVWFFAANMFLKDHVNEGRPCSRQDFDVGAGRAVLSSLARFTS